MLFYFMRFCLLFQFGQSPYRRTIRGREVSSQAQPSLTVLWTTGEVPTTPESFKPNHMVLLQRRVPRPLPVITDGEAQIPDPPTVDDLTDFSQVSGSDINEVPSQFEITETTPVEQKLGYKWFLYTKKAQKWHRRTLNCHGVVTTRMKFSFLTVKRFQRNYFIILYIYIYIYIYIYMWCTIRIRLCFRLTIYTKQFNMMDNSQGKLSLQSSVFFTYISYCNYHIIVILYTLLFVIFYGGANVLLILF